MHLHEMNNIDHYYQSGNVFDRYHNVANGLMGGNETWTLQKDRQDLLEGKEMSMIRWMTGIKRIEKTWTLRKDRQDLLEGNEMSIFRWMTGVKWIEKTWTLRKDGQYLLEGK